MPLVYDQFYSGMLNKVKYCSGWNITVLALADGRAIMFTIPRHCTELFKNVEDVITHYTKVVAVVLFRCMMYAPLPPLTISEIAYVWLLTGHLLLDLYHARFSQDLHIGHGPPSAGIKAAEAVGWPRC